MNLPLTSHTWQCIVKIYHLLTIIKPSVKELILLISSWEVLNHEKQKNFVNSTSFILFKIAG